MADDITDNQAPLESAQAEGTEDILEAPKPKPRKREPKLTREQLQALVDTMYNPDKTSISRDELDSILENPDVAGEITFAYHSITGGLSFIDEARYGVSRPVLHLKGNGELNRISTRELKDIIDNHPEHGETIYSMFASGELTMERVAITDHLYASNFIHQVNKFLHKNPSLRINV